MLLLKTANAKTQLDFDLDHDSKDLLTIEKLLWSRGYKNVIGVDEAGRGPLAGPVVACALSFSHTIDFSNISFFDEINDSKQVDAKKRIAIFEKLSTFPEIQWASSIIDAATIDQINIRKASLLAMKRAIESLSLSIDIVIVDGRDAPTVDLEVVPIIKGDTKSKTIALASIFAKVLRDRIMVDYDSEYPYYGMKSHKGYGTKMHIDALKEHGLSPIHRKSFCKNFA